MNKKGTQLFSQETLEIILTVAGVIILGVLFFKLLAPYFDKTEETSKSYFENLKKAIASADSTGTGDFYIQQYSGKSGWVLVYFGSVTTYTTQGITLHISQKRKNQACICSNYFAGEIPVCKKDYCLSLKYPAVWPGWNKENFIVSSPAKIEKKENNYTFSNIA